MRALRSAALLAAIACLTAGPSAQGLADAARLASSAPQQPATKKYTNDDVETAKPAAPAPATPGDTAADAPKSDEGTTASDASGASAEETKAADAKPKKTPEYLLTRIPQLRAQLANKEKQLRELQARGDTSGAALVTNQIASVQKELRMHEARVAAATPAR